MSNDHVASLSQATNFAEAFQNFVRAMGWVPDTQLDHARVRAQRWFRAHDLDRHLRHASDGSCDCPDFRKAFASDLLYLVYPSVFANVPQDELARRARAFSGWYSDTEKLFRLTAKFYSALLSVPS